MHYRKPVAFWDVESVEKWRESAERGLEWVLGKRKGLKRELELERVSVGGTGKASIRGGDGGMGKKVNGETKDDTDEKVEIGLGPATEPMRIEVEVVMRKNNVVNSARRFKSVYI
jgi:hypothetical protein